MPELHELYSFSVLASLAVLVVLALIDAPRWTTGDGASAGTGESVREPPLGLPGGEAASESGRAIEVVERASEEKRPLRLLLLLCCATSIWCSRRWKTWWSSSLPALRARAAGVYPAGGSPNGR